MNIIEKNHPRAVYNRREEDAYLLQDLSQVAHKERRYRSGNAQPLEEGEVMLEMPEN